ncbi:NUDIX hydrolase [Pseudonocardia hispaniensis]|uniref:NUDIX hydrolase n=1 Tax=Pseudonocardia hispaniensis TaxID=904933 RepID=A0ABW1IZN5_9PSEU
MTEGSGHIPCVGAIVRDRSGRLLLVQRANEPGAGLWAVPGGRVEPGETDHAAVVRETAEETGLTVRVGPLAGEVVRGPFRIADYHCEPAGGRLQAGDDATDARWVDAAGLAQLPLVDGLLEALTEWDALPR